MLYSSVDFDKYIMFYIYQYSIIECSRDFPAGPVVKTPLCSQCMGYGFSPWLGNENKEKRIISLP